jgi:ABC-type branched-subunit amino acid transport system substrate-binding protein
LISACSSSSKGASTTTTAPAVTTTTASSTASSTGSSTAATTESSTGSSTAPTTGGSTATTGGSSGGPVQGVTDTEIKVDIIATLTTQNGSPPFPGLEDGAKARIARVNAAGGIDGRKITVVNTLDDNGVATTYSDQVTKAIQQDKVFGIITTSNAFTTQASDLMVKAKVPFFGWAYLPAFCDNPWAFGWFGCNAGGHNPDDTHIAQLMNAATGKDAKDLTWVVQANDDPASSGSAKLVADQATAVGSKVLFTDTSIPSATQTTDYSPYVQKIIAAKPDIVYVATNFTDVLGMTAALRAAGYTGEIANGVAYVPGLLEKSPDVAAALEGSTIYGSFPAQESETPAIKQMETDMQAIGKDPALSTGVQVGYWSADFLIQALTKVGKNLTPDTFESVINGGFTTTPLDGGIGAVTYPADHSAAPPCGAAISVKDGKYVPVVPYKCFSS